MKSSRYVDTLKDRIQFEFYIMVSRDLLKYAGASKETIKEVFDNRGSKHE